ncbi:hypothetical protein EJ02DRAFT_237452 [Clathrospora elynae]|uniref:Uncharacterized protein n=1 Tax=Clathrospora elynae TaxID=706981 RepID=A0A6A5ST48_9PLEO|nr:hypothetical protein EJ02DRAFT_237452 [Clathrospora elynae]
MSLRLLALAPWLPRTHTLLHKYSCASNTLSCNTATSFTTHFLPSLFHFSSYLHVVVAKAFRPRPCACFAYLWAYVIAPGSEQQGASNTFTSWSVCRMP